MATVTKRAMASAPRQRGWRVFEGSNDGDGAKDMATCITTGERG
jgi:hypothetical protein